MAQRIFHFLGERLVDETSLQGLADGYHQVKVTPAHLALEPQVGPVLYELIAGRYQKGATIITSNKSLANWGELVGATGLMMAIIDRLLHQGEVFYLRGTSYRLRGKEPVTLTVKPDRSGAATNGKA